MIDVYDLYDEYIYINGCWEKLGGSSGGASQSILNFDESITASELASLDPNDFAIGTSYNLKDTFITDSRFIEGAGISYPAGTCITVIKKGSLKYFNVLGQIFNVDQIENEIAALATLIANLQLSWSNIIDKPFTSVGDGLDVNEDGEINANQILEMIATLTVQWSQIENRPFETIGTGLVVTEDAVLKVLWDTIEDRPFDEIGSGLVIENGVLKVVPQTINWDDINSKPFDTVYTSDFTIRTSGGKNRLELNPNMKHYPLYSSDINDILSYIVS